MLLVVAVFVLAIVIHHKELITPQVDITLEYPDLPATDEKDTVVGHYVWVVPDNDIPLTENFMSSEFVSKCPDMHKTKISIRVIELAQKIRDLTERKILIRSTTRSEGCNADNGGARDSRHLPHHADALDLRLIDDEGNYDYAATYRLKSHFIGDNCDLHCIYLKDQGLGAIGFYASGLVHIDTRPGDLIKWGTTEEELYQTANCKL